MYSNKVCNENALKGIRSCDCFACLGMLRASSYIEISHEISAIYARNSTYALVQLSYS